MAWCKKRWIFSLGCVVLVIAMYVAHPLYLRALGQMLVISNPVVRADAILVLDGDYPQDERLLYAVQLWRQGVAPRVLLSAPLADWQTYQDYPSWRHAMKLRMMPSRFLEVVPNRADSTKEEAEVLLPFMREHGYRSVIVVTSNYHTRRTRKVFREAWEDSGIRLSVSAAPSSQFHPADWWRHRADSRTFLLEYTKIIWYAVME